IYDEFITKQKTNFSYIDVKDCYESFPYDKDVASKIDVKQLIADLKDAHTVYSSDCFTSFYFYTNMTFYSVINDGKQIIKVFNDTTDQSNIDCEVTHIDGQEAYQVIYEFAKDSVYASKDLGVRFNIALDLTFLTFSFALRNKIPVNPDITYTLKCDGNNEFHIKRNWNAFSTSTVLNRFNDSKTYYENICNPTKIPMSSKLELQEITKTFNGANRILAEQDLSVTIVRIVDNFVGFFKQQDIGIIKIITEDPHTLNITELVQGFNELANTGVKKVVLDFSDNGGGKYDVVLFINLLLFPDTYPTFDFDTRLSEQMRLAIAEQFKVANPNPDNIFDLREFDNAKTHVNFTSIDDFFGKNVYIRGGVTGNYSNKYAKSSITFNKIRKIIQTNLISPLPWKPEDYIILTNGLCGSSCSHIAEHAAEFNNVTTVAVGGIVHNPLLSYSSFPGGFVYNTSEILDSLGQLNLLNNTLIPKPFPLTGMDLTFPLNEMYSKLHPDEISEFAFRPADFRLCYDQNNVRNISLLWSQAAALIGSKPKS
ncbi:3320_t:CDS:2, partial [Cetraspora pellucida]